MKVGYLVNTNSKGQLVIPAQIRKQLQIDEQVPLQLVVKNGVIQIAPVTAVMTAATSVADSYLDTLTKTKGSWSKDKNGNSMRRAIELTAAMVRRKAQW